MRLVPLNSDTDALGPTSVVPGSGTAAIPAPKMRLRPLAKEDLGPGHPLLAEFAKAGGKLEQGYEALAKPVTSAVEKGQEYIGVPQSIAKLIAQTIVPQTGTGALLDVAGLALPELGAGKLAGTAATMGERLLGSHLGRAGVMGAIGAGGEALTGGSPLTGFEQGAGGELLGQGAHDVASMVSHRVGLPAMLRDTTARFGQSLSEVFPWLGKMETSKDLADNFVRFGALKKATALLQQSKGDAARAAKNETFEVPIPELISRGVGKRTAPVSFQEADRRLTEMNHHIYLPSGEQRSGVGVPDWQHLAGETEKLIVGRLNEIKPGLGDSYDTARSRVDAAYVLGGSPRYPGSGVFGNPRVWDTRHGTINPSFLSQQIDEHTGKLQRSMGDSGIQHVQDTLKRGAEGQVADVPASGHPTLRGGVSPATMTPRVFATLGQSYKAVGKTPSYFDLPHSKTTEPLTQNIVSEMRANQPDEHSPGPGMKALDKSRAEYLAPTPSASKRAEKVGEQLRKGKTPEVHGDLNRGRLSMDETNKLVQHASSTDPAAMVQNMPLTEMLDAFEQADAHERQVLIPFVIERLKKELPQTQNKTLQANLSQRFQRIQQTPRMADKEVTA